MPLGVPALVVALPNNLSPFVEAGMSAPDLGRVGPALGPCCMIGRCASGRAARRPSMRRYRIEADGAAAGRAADVILRLTRT